jgi:transcription termination factor Rho
MRLSGSPDEKSELVMRCFRASDEQQGNSSAAHSGIMADGYGFLDRGVCYPAPPYLRFTIADTRFGLRTGDMVVGQGRPAKTGEKYYSLLRVEAINDLNPEASKCRPYFNTLTPIYPDKLIDLETTPDNLSTRLLNLIAPVGRGQRGLIVSPPKAGKTMLLKKIANAATTNYSDIALIVCLIGERPKRLPIWRRSVRGQVIAATFDEPVENHHTALPS